MARTPIKLKFFSAAMADPPIAQKVENGEDKTRGAIIKTAEQASLR